MEFFRVVTPERIFEELAGFRRVGTETVAPGAALSRVLAEDVVSAEDLPPGPRATMDGYAVRAGDTFGASESVPALLKAVGEVRMGSVPGFGIGAGEAAAVPTGGFLPGGADAVVMVEYAAPAGGGAVEVTRPVTAGENVLERAGDVARGQKVLPRGRRLRPQDVGLLAGLGVEEVVVYRKPVVAVFSTGNEVTPVGRAPSPGQVRDVNTYSICALVRASGGEAVPLDVVPDDPDLIGSAINEALSRGDAAALSGGTSVGRRDHVMEVVGRLPGARVIAHGVAISPGKPTLLASVGGKALFGLPGHPVSALVVAQVFLAPFLRYLEGGELTRRPGGRRVEAELTTSVHSAHGREEYVRVSIEERDGRAYAVPVFGRSGAINALVRADGFFIVPVHSEGAPGGERVEVFLF
ncbi:MAG: gephyrin-like molybdotransferase Glp [bacterium]